MQTCPIVNGVLSESLPCETNQAFDDWTVAYNAASVQYRALLQADYERYQARAKSRSHRR